VRTKIKEGGKLRKDGRKGGWRLGKDGSEGSGSEGS
jgi:hypothetical protein